MNGRPSSLVVLSLVALAGAHPVRAAARPLPPVDRALLREAPRLMKHCRKHGYRNIGVLKFRIRKGKAAPTDHAGTLNLRLARWLEQALFLQEDAADPLGVIRNASATAATLAGANHLDERRRDRLFEGKYQLKWGEKGATVAAGAFFTGEVSWAADLKTMEVTVHCLARKKAPQQVAKFSARAGIEELVEGGENFNIVRGDSPDSAVRRAAAVRKGELPPPLSGRARPPVELKVLYGRRPVDLEFLRDGTTRIPEPKEGEQVAFVLRRTKAAGSGRFAVVLKVNGENTLYRQRKEDLACTKWVLEPGTAAVRIEGFQVDDGSARRFVVKSPKESRENEVDYGDDVGTISLVVYREKGKKPGKGEETEEDRQAAKLHATDPKDRPRKLGALQYHYEKRVSVRGLIEEGTRKTASRVEGVRFAVDPVPVLATTIVYYDP